MKMPVTLMDLQQMVNDAIGEALAMGIDVHSTPITSDGKTVINKFEIIVDDHTVVLKQN